MNLGKIAQEYAEKSVSKDKKIKAVFLTGSIARNAADSKSDIDLVFFYDSVPGNQKDNIFWEEFSGAKIQIVKTSFSEVIKDIESKQAFRVSEMKDSVPLIDKEKYHKKIKERLEGFSFNVNLQARVKQAIDGLKDAKAAIEKGDETTARLLADLYSFWIVRDYLHFKENPHTMPKRLLEELKAQNKEIAFLFAETINQNKTQEKLALFEKLIKEIEKQ